MSITFILHGKQRRELHLPRQHIMLFSILFFLSLVLGVTLFWQQSQLKITTLKAELIQSNVEPLQHDGSNTANVDDQLLALAAQVGMLQGQLSKLNALGERLTKQAELDPDEFNFTTPFSLPLEAISLADEPKMSIDELQTSLLQLEQQLKIGHEQLEVLESFIVNHHIKDSLLIASLPVAQDKVKISSSFGSRADPFNRQKKQHKGIDFRGEYGSPIFASGRGVVSKAGRHRGFGNIVEIDHGNGLITRYAHNSKLLVEVGSLVDEGQKIALMGRTGRATGVHLHYEVLKNGRQVNPEHFLSVRAG